MTGRERIRKVIAGEIPDRVPVGALVTEQQATASGIPLGDIHRNVDLAIQAFKKTLEAYEGTDMAIAPEVGITKLAPIPDGHSAWFFNWVLPGPGSNEVPQMIEEEIITGEQYGLLREKGLLYFLRPDRPDINELFAITGALTAKAGEISPLLESKQLWNYATAIISLPTDLIANFRGLEGYMADFIDRPEEIVKTSEWLLPSFIKLGLEVTTSPNPDKTILIGANRASASYISPKMFRKYIAPFFRRILDAVLGAGHVPVLHLDGNWTPMADWFLEMPPHRMIFHLDDENDLYEWKRILGKHSALMGNVPATLLAFGTPEEVGEHCRRLIDDIGDGGGFVLSNACALPIDARVANVRAMIEAAHKYGKY